MRRKKRMKSVEESKLEMTPMIDVVFQLLIFFMCSMEFSKSDAIIKAFLPKDRGLNQTTPEVPPDVRIKLLWCEPGTTRETKDPERGEVVLKIGTKVFARAGAEPDWDDLYRELLILRDGFHRGDCPDGLPIIIDARPVVPHGSVVSALNACVKAKLRDVTFAAPGRPID